MKRIISATLAIILAALTLSSCGKGDNETTKAVDSSQTAQTVTVSEEESKKASATTVKGGQTTTAKSSSKTTTAAGTKSGTTASSKTTGATQAVKTTKKTTAKPTTKKQTTSKYEVSPSSVRTVIGTVTRAWKASQNGVSVEIHRVKYGGKITQDFHKANGDGAIDYDKKVTYQPYISVAVITAPPTRFKIATTKSMTGKNLGGTNEVALKAGAFVALNGEAGPYNNKSHYASTVRNGKVEFNYTKTCTKNVLLVYKDGRWEQGTIDSSNAASLISKGLVNTIKYHTQINKNGNYVENTWDGKNGNLYYHNRSVLGRISDNKFVFAVGEFMPLKNIATVLKAYGVKDSYLINGGNCSEMFLKGVGNTTGIAGKQLNNLNKINYLESEFFYQQGMLGLSGGYQKTGGPCYDDPDIFYFS